MLPLSKITKGIIMLGKYFGHVQNAQGTLETDFYSIIPFLLFVSKSYIMPGEACVWSLHITPFIAIGIVGRCKK